MDINKVLNRFLDLFGYHRRGHGISIIIPFKASRHITRQAVNFEWVKRYWKHQLPGAEVIVGEDPDTDRPFSKSVAINDGVALSSGDILVIADADGYMDVDSVLYCSHKIRTSRRRGFPLWYVPYRQFYRLTDEASRRVLNSSPSHPYRFPTPPRRHDIQGTMSSESTGRGHWYGALFQIMPREAFDEVGGWDERFRGWGGEDHSAMRAIDTLYGPHKTLPGQVLHLWHPVMSKEGIKDWVEFKDRIWDDQPVAENNGTLAYRYSIINGDVKRMRALIAEGRKK